uniref:Cytochrome b n=3 Tax=Theileria annulata TaxID=5874 RepID=A0A2R4KZS9_THEAN|nr:cytochrome b [Theileria annulata]AVV68810.1 cytochrome b [Theileria annulata]AVV68811.1 cytochrome b [Theileria annulata]AVV68812.1 cytochrome b [Theileria annulata]AVV68814.1 cytochrome b [Theileria annulata]
MNLFNSHLLSYMVPKNLNLNWNFGFILGILLVLQIISGLMLSFFYVPAKGMAFESTLAVMLNICFGWFVRLYHSFGVSFYFFFMFLHIMKGMWYSSNHLPWSWYSGVVIFVLSIATAFVGYVLPDGQMSFWGATVIGGLLKFFGKTNVLIFGGQTVGPETLERFFSIHVILPVIILLVVIFHLYVLHRDGSSNPLAVIDMLAVFRFHPVVLFSDIRFIVIVILLIGVQSGYGFISIFQADPDNSILSDPLNTPAHIIPEWYLLLFYATLKVFPTKVAGLLAMAGMLELLVLLVESRYFKQTVSAMNYHRVWTTSSVPLVPVLFMLGSIGKMVVHVDLIAIGTCVVLSVVLFIYKLLDSARVRA